MTVRSDVDLYSLQSFVPRKTSTDAGSGLEHSVLRGHCAYIERVKAFHNRLLQLATALHFDKRDRVHLCRVALYCTLLELAGNVLHLIEHKRRTGVPSLFRDCMKDVGYSDHITASHCYEWLRLLKEAKKGTNRYLTSIAASQNLNEEIANYEKQLQELKARGKRPLTIFEI